MSDDAPIKEIDTLLNQSQGNLIAFEFTIFIEGGQDQEVDSNVGGEPLTFQVGAGEMMPALEEQLVTMEAGESRSIVLSPEKAYGPIHAEAIREFPLDSIPEEARQVGRKVMCRAPNGSEQMLDVVEIRGDKVALDFNHPLAGETLRFEVKILSNDPCTH